MEIWLSLISSMLTYSVRRYGKLTAEMKRCDSLKTKDLWGAKVSKTLVNHLN